MQRALLALLAAPIAAGCVTFTPRLVTGDGQAVAADTEVGTARFHLEFVRADERTASEVVEALQVAVPRIERWGKFEAPVNLRIQPSHEALETAVRRDGYPWLRAWARYDSIDLQSPRTWSLLGASKRDVVELLTHELTHCLMYQRAATAEDWTRKEIPLWFREGMASYTAEQGYRRYKPEDIWRYLRSNPGKDPVGDADSLYQGEADVVYGSAHRAFEYLVDRTGEEGVAKILDAMRAGQAFGEAFAVVAGLSPKAFEHEFVEFVRLEQFRARKLRLPGAAGDRITN